MSDHPAGGCPVAVGLVMKIRVGLGVSTFIAFISVVPHAEAQVETTTAAAGYWNYAANPNAPPAVNLTDQQSNSVFNDTPPFIAEGVSASATYNDPTAVPSIGTATANSTIINQSINPIVPNFIAGLVGETNPQISLDAQAISTYPANVGFNGNLPLGSATATVSDGIKFCVASAGGCGALVNPSPAGYTLQVTVDYGASLHSVQNGENIGAAIGTSMTIATSFDGISGQTGLIQQGSKDFASLGSQVFNFFDFNPNDLNSFASFSLFADISASPFSDGSEAVTFDDPITLTLLDSNGDVVPNLFVESQNGFFYEITDGAATPGTSTTPIPAALPLFAAGIGGLGLLSWRRKRNAQAVAA